MNEFTLQAKDWLDRRFSLGGRRPYQPHFDNTVFGQGQAGFLSALGMSCRIAMMLSRMQFENIIDIGAADGFNAAFFRQLFLVPTVACDLSSEALFRARERFGLTTVGADSHQLPFENDSFDVVVCNETIEHVHNPIQCMLELHRVAKRFLIISTLEYEHKSIWRNLAIRQLNPDYIHAHRTLFTHTDFEQLFTNLHLLPQLQDFQSISPFELTDKGLSQDEAKHKLAVITSPKKFGYRKYGVLAIVEKNGSRLSESGSITQQEIIDQAFEAMPLRLDGPMHADGQLPKKLACPSCYPSDLARLEYSPPREALVCSSGLHAYPITSNTLLLYPEDTLAIQTLSRESFTIRYPGIDHQRVVALQNDLLALSTSSSKTGRVAIRLGQAGMNLALHPLAFTRYQMHKLEMLSHGRRLEA